MKRPSAETVVNVVAMAASLHGEDYRGVLLGFPDLYSRDLAYCVLRRLHPQMSRSDTARLVGATDIYVQARMGKLYRIRRGWIGDCLIAGIVDHIRKSKKVVKGVERQSSEWRQQRYNKPPPKRRHNYVDASRGRGHASKYVVDAYDRQDRISYRPDGTPDSRGALSLTSVMMGDPDASRSAARVPRDEYLPEPSIKELCRGLSAARAPRRVAVLGED